MKDSVIQRDVAMQEKFGNSLLAFAMIMKGNCTTMKNHILESEKYMQAANIALALVNLKDMIERIEDLLPQITEFGNAQLAQAKKLRELEDWPLKK